MNGIYIQIHKVTEHSEFHSTHWYHCFRKKMEWKLYPSTQANEHVRFHLYTYNHEMHAKIMLISVFTLMREIVRKRLKWILYRCNSVALLTLDLYHYLQYSFSSCAATCENVPSGKCGQRRPRPAWASAQSVQDLHWSLTESLDTTECMNWAQRPGWCFTHAQADLNLRMFEGTFSFDMAHMAPNVFFYIFIWTWFVSFDFDLNFCALLAVCLTYRGPVLKYINSLNCWHFLHVLVSKPLLDEW